METLIILSGCLIGALTLWRVHRDLEALRKEDI